MIFLIHCTLGQRISRGQEKTVNIQFQIHKERVKIVILEKEKYIQSIN